MRDNDVELKGSLQRGSTLCERQEELMAETQRHLIRLAELAKQESEAIASRNENLILALDKEIENTLGFKERALGALHEHREEHGC